MLKNDRVSSDNLAGCSFRGQRLAGEDPELRSLRPRKIRNLRIRDNKSLAYWQGKSTVSLVDSIYDKIEDIKAYYPHPKSRKKRRWNVRVANIRNRILLLLANASFS